MTAYIFDIPLLASITITADDPETARDILQTALENSPAIIGGFRGEVSLTEDINIWSHLGMIDGVDCVNQFGRRAI